MILNKQILGQLKETTQSLQSLLEQKDKVIEDAKSEMSPEQLKEFHAMEKVMNKQLKDKDFNGAFRTIQKFQSKK